MLNSLVPSTELKKRYMQSSDVSGALLVRDVTT